MSRAVVVVTGVTSSGDREVLGGEVGDRDDGAFWKSLLHRFRAPGFTRVQLVISDHHLGVQSSIQMLSPIDYEMIRIVSQQLHKMRPQP